MELDPLSRTALIPYWARVHDGQSPQPLLGDKAAVSIAPEVTELFGSVEVSRSTRVGCCLRNLIVDRWLLDLSGHETVIVEIGVGLSTRFHRLPTIAKRYIEVDSESITTLRNDLLPVGDVTRISGDGMNVGAWAYAVGAVNPGQTIITLEGVLAYQHPDTVARFFAQAASAYPGAYIVFDRLSASAVARANRPRSRAGDRPEYLWSARGGRRITSGETRLRIVREQGFMSLPRDLRTAFAPRERLAHALPPRRGAYKLLLCQLPQVEGRLRPSW